MTVDYDSGVDWDEVVKDYTGWELTTREIVAKHRLFGPPELYRFLHARGIPLRGYRRSLADKRRVAQCVYWYCMSDTPVRTLCRVWKVGTVTLYDALREYGIPLRSKWMEEEI